LPLVGVFHLTSEEAMELTITVERDLTKDSAQMDEAWALYQKCFTQINNQAAMRHLMYWEEFLDMATDSAVEKHVAWATQKHVAGIDRKMVGLSAITNDLISWPLISPAYFRRLWPEQAEAGKLWYVGFVGVLPEGQMSGTFARLLESMTKGRRGTGDLFFMDFCSRNTARGLPDVVEKILIRIHKPGRVRMYSIDSQRVDEVEFLEATP
jgi:hypothetical protein